MNVQNHCKQWALSLLVALSILGLSSDSPAAPTTPEQATGVVKKWLKLHPSPLRTGLGAVISNVKGYGEQGDIHYYVAFLDPQGFIVVSADDLVEPIIAFSSGKAFDPSDRHPLGLMLAKDLPHRVKKAREEEADKIRKGTPLSHAHRKALSKWGDLLLNSEDNSPPVGYLPSLPDVRVSPLTQSVWSQGNEGSSPCYNWYTPNHYVSGCTATAMAQLMRYFAYPDSPVVTSNTIYVDGQSQSATIRGGNGSGGAYDWSNMILNPNASTGTTQRQAIGALLFDAGVSVNMHYSASASATYNTETTVTSALKSTFKYGNAIASISPAGSLNLILNPNLDAKYPVLMALYASTGNVGHAVIADGYGYDSLSTLYHHINMGWGAEDAAANAWYNLPNVDRQYPFDVVSGCIYNIFTSGTGEIISGRVLDASGYPISQVTVTGTTAGGTYTAVTDSAGIYALAKIPSSTSVMMNAAKSGYSFQSRTVSTGLSRYWPQSVGNLWGIDLTGQYDASSALKNDFNADGKPDILWRNPTSGDNYVWFMNGTQFSGSALLFNVPTAWEIVGVGDFNADGKPDILWRNPTTGDTYVWFMNGTTFAGSALLFSVPSPWQIVGVGDFNTDGKPDILWRNPTTGDTYVWFMNGTTFTGSALLFNVPSPWQIVGVGDFNSDGKPDILWRNPTTGDNYVWFMNGTAFAGSSFLFNVPSPWQIVGTGDFNADGKPDILWRNPTTGDTYVWFMNGTAFAGSALLFNVPTPWEIVGH